MTKTVLGAGALATAVGAILSLFAHHPTVNQASFSSVQLVGQEPINEFQQRATWFSSLVIDDPSAEPSPDDGGGSLSAPPSPSVPDGSASGGTGASAGTGGSGTPSSSASSTPTATPSASPSHPGRVGHGVVINLPIGPPSRYLNTWCQQVERRVQSEVSSCSPPVRALYVESSPALTLGRLVSPQEAANRVNVILSQTATTRIAGQKPEPLGEIVNVNLELAGLRGRPVYLAWSIYPGNSKTSLYGKWLNQFVAYRLEATTDDDTGSVELWVPLPKAPGSYFVRVALITDNADLASDDSPPFG